MNRQTATEVLDGTFLEVRAKLLEVAAALDRIDRSAEHGGPLSEEGELRRRAGSG